MTTDPDARLYRKGPGQEAKLCFVGHVLMENGHGLVVDAELTRASGHAERLAAPDSRGDSRRSGQHRWAAREHRLGVSGRPKQTFPSKFLKKLFKRGLTGQVCRLRFPAAVIFFTPLWLILLPHILGKPTAQKHHREIQMNTKRHPSPEKVDHSLRRRHLGQLGTQYTYNFRKPIIPAGLLVAYLALTPYTNAVHAASYVTNIDPVPTPTMGVPHYKASNPLSAAYRDQRFGTLVVRITGEPGSPILINGSSKSKRDWPKHTCHQYSSNDNAWNADSSLLVLNGCENRYGILLDGNTFKVLRVGLAGPGVRFWSRTDPEKMYGIGNNTVVEIFPRTDKTKTLMTLQGYSGLTLDGHGQNSSDDGKWMAVTAKRQSDGRKVMFGINLETHTKGPDIVAPSNLNQGENVFISASGKYLIAALGYGGKDQDIHDVTTGKCVNTYRGDITTKHADTYLLNGRDYWVFVASGGGKSGRVMRRDILTNQEYTYMDIGVANHVSTRDVGDGRWAIVTYDSTRKPNPLEIVAVRVDGDHRNVVRRLAKHNSVRKSYSDEPHPNPSPDGKKIVFASNWGSGPTSAYVILLPDWDTPAGRKLVH